MPETVLCGSWLTAAPRLAALSGALSTAALSDASATDWLKLLADAGMSRKEIRKLNEERRIELQEIGSTPTDPHLPCPRCPTAPAAGPARNDSQ